MASPNRDITDISASQSQKEVTHNEAVHNLEVGQETDFIINGAMRVQRRPGPFTDMGANAFEITLDMMAAYTQGAPQARATITQESNFTGFHKSLKIDCTTAEDAVAATELWAFQTRVMALRLRGLDWGAAGAKDLALTFTVMSPKSGTHCVALYQPDGNRRFIREFTVATADTQQTFTVIFPGDASGTIDDDNAEGLRVTWPLVAGANFQGAADGWAGGEDYATDNQQNLLDNVANDFEITGISLRTGSVNVGNVFIPRAIEDELRLCKAHYQRLGLGCTGVWSTDSICFVGTVLPVEMNGTPALNLLDTSPVVRDATDDLTGSSSAIASSLVTAEGFQAEVNGFGAAATAGDPAIVNQTADVFELVYDL